MTSKQRSIHRSFSTIGSFPHQSINPNARPVSGDSVSSTNDNLAVACSIPSIDEDSFPKYTASSADASPNYVLELSPSDRQLIAVNLDSEFKYNIEKVAELKEENVVLPKSRGKTQTCPRVWMPPGHPLRPCQNTFKPYGNVSTNFCKLNLSTSTSTQPSWKHQRTRRNCSSLPTKT